MNRGPRAPGAPSSGATEIFLGKTLRKIIEIVATMQMTYFKAKMHQIRFRLGLRPRTRYRELTALPQTSQLDLGTASRRGRGWSGEEEGNGAGKGGTGGGSGGEGKGGPQHCKGRYLHIQRFTQLSVSYIIGQKYQLLLKQAPSEPCYATDHQKTFSFSIMGPPNLRGPGTGAPLFMRATVMDMVSFCFLIYVSN